MANKIKINFGGREVEATPVEVNQSSERWNEYLLDDSTILKIKLVATKFLRIDNEYDAEGNPAYIVQSTNVLNATSPENLKRKKI